MEPILGKNKLSSGKIHSINISKTKGISKDPVKAAELLVDFGVKGDAHAGPGIRQVSLLALESIEKQMSSSEVMRSRVNLKPGDFAENITTEGLNLAQLNIGAKVKVGKEAILEISKIGKECHKYCAVYQKVGDCIMPRKGIFAKVVKDGEIAVGDEMEVIDNENWSKKASPKDIDGFTFAVLTVSDRCSRGESKDESGRIIIGTVNTINAKNIQYDIIPDEIELIKEKLIFYCDKLKIDVVFTTGGTGLGPRDVTPEATSEIAEKIIPGIPEVIRLEGVKKTKNAALSRGISAIRGKTVIINLPGSPRGVEESLTVILDLIPHALDMVRGKGHSNARHR